MNNENKLAGGVYAALATPRRKNVMEADTGALLDYLDWVARSGVDGIVLFGSTGDFVHFDLADRMHALRLSIRRSRIPVLVNISHSTLDGSISLADDAIECGAAGLLLMPPYFYRYGDEEIREFYFRFIKTIGMRVPVYLYNLPAYSNPISPSLASDLLTTGHFAGIKDSSGDWNMLEALLALKKAHNDLRIIVGHESVYLRGRREGASGTVSGIAAAVPELVVALDRAIAQGNDERAELLNGRLLELLERIQQFPGTFGIKQAAVVRGRPLDQTAVPLGLSAAAELENFQTWIRDWLPSVLKECLLP